MSLTFNEFQRELQKRNIDPNTAYMLTLVYERLGETVRIVEEMAKLTETFADSVARMVIMNQADQKTMSEMAKKLGMVGRTPGVEVASVAHDPNDGD